MQRVPLLLAAVLPCSVVAASAAAQQAAARPDSTCMVTYEAPYRAPVLVTPAGDTLVASGADTVPALVQFPPSMPWYATHHPWFVEGDTLRVWGAPFVRAPEPPVTFGPDELERVADTAGVAIYARAQAARSVLTEVFVPVRVSCLFQRYLLAPGTQPPPAPAVDTLFVPPSPPPPPAIPVEAPGPRPYVDVKVVFGTDRNRTGRNGAPKWFGNTSTGLTYGVATVSIPRVHQFARMERPSWFGGNRSEDPAVHIVLRNAEPLPRDTALRRLRGMVQGTRSKAVLVFIHGYNVSFEEAARRAAQMAYDLRTTTPQFDGVPMLYSWPSRGELRDYLTDERTVARSTAYVERFLRDVAARSGAAEVHLIAHSMGNRALLAALQRVAATGTPRFNEVILAAPDVTSELFVDSIAPAIRNVARRVTLYASAGDLALRASAAIHPGVGRAGLAGPSMPIVPGVESIDATYVDFSEVLGHSYFAGSRVLPDIARILATHTPPPRPGLERRRRGAQVFWQLP